MKIYKLERTLLVFTIAALAFLTGWSLGAGAGGAPYEITVERAATAAAPAVADTENPAPGLLEGEVININTASAADLERLPGIGGKRAEDIITYRKEHGPFRIVEELTNIPGIGEKTMQGLLDYITVGKG